MINTSTLTDSQIFAYRKRLREMKKKLEWLASWWLFQDELVIGTPHEVMRKCGQASCKCANDS